MDPTSTAQAPPPRLFGTDGVRGRAGDGWLTEERVSALGRAVGRVVARSSAGERRALIGHDGRRSGPGLEAALARGLRAAGLAPASAGLITTPGLAHLTAARHYAVGLMVSASHNPAADNGIKLFGPGGQKLADELEDAVEAEWRRAPEAVTGGAAPEPDAGLEAAYEAHLVAAAAGLDLAGLSIVIDCANGGGSRVMSSVLRRLGASVHALACAPDGDNINADCGSTHPDRLRAAVVEHGADVGVALDGDGDRCLLVDESGALVDGDGLMTLLAVHLAERGALPGRRIVATVMSNRGLHRALRERGIGVVTVDVGDRRVVEGMRREGLGLGGEQSGHIVFADNDHIGDGVLTALRALAVLVDTRTSLSSATAAFRAFPQVLVNVPVVARRPWSELPAVQAIVRDAERELGEDGRVLLRYSGTEALARVMVEGPEPAAIQAHAHAIAAAVRAAIGA